MEPEQRSGISQQLVALTTLIISYLHKLASQFVSRFMWVVCHSGPNRFSRICGEGLFFFFSLALGPLLQFLFSVKSYYLHAIHFNSAGGVLPSSLVYMPGTDQIALSTIDSKENIVVLNIADGSGECQIEETDTVTAPSDRALHGHWPDGRITNWDTRSSAAQRQRRDRDTIPDFHPRAGSYLVLTVTATSCSRSH